MIEIIDFLPNEEVTQGIGYRGNAGRKQAYIHNGVLYMVKFPQSTKDMKGKHLPSYTSSPISEYIGSQIYASLGIPVHETVLGRCQNKIVVGCKDFTEKAITLLDYHQIKNTVDEDLLSGSCGSSSRGERLSDVLKVIDSARNFDPVRKQAKERFWDMFVVDAFIRNNDRNNSNWGLLVGQVFNKIYIQLAPVFDNGNAFFNKRNVSAAECRLEDDADIYNDIKTGVSFFMDDQERHIHPFEYMADMESKDCNAAVLRFAERLNMDAVKQIINDIPEEAYELPVMPDVQKKFYIQMLETAWRNEILPIAERLKEKSGFACR